MRLVVSSTFSYKDCHENYRGPTTQSYSFAKDEAIPLEKMLWLLSKTVLEHYAVFSSAEEMNKSLEKFNQYMNHVEIT